MNGWQRLVLVVGLVVAMGLAAFPKWRVMHITGHTTTRALIFSPGDALRRSLGDELRRQFTARIVWWRFALEQGIVWVPTVVIVLLLRKRGRG